MIWEAWEKCVELLRVNITALKTFHILSGSDVIKVGQGFVIDVIAFNEAGASKNSLMAFVIAGGSRLGIGPKQCKGDDTRNTHDMLLKLLDALSQEIKGPVKSLQEILGRGLISAMELPMLAAKRGRYEAIDRPIGWDGSR